MFRPLHGPEGFHTGHGSCFCHPPLDGYPRASLPRRLARPVLLSGVSPLRSPGCSGSLSGAGYCGQPREVQPCSICGCPLSRGGPHTQYFLASPSPDRVSRLLSTIGEFLSSASPPASVWLCLLGIPSSMAHLVPGARLRMRSLQLCLHWSRDRVDQSTPIAWSPDCLRDLQWWLHLPRLSQGVSLHQVSPDLDFWSDASDVG